MQRGQDDLALFEQVIERGETIERGGAQRHEIDVLVAQRLAQRGLVALAQRQQLLEHGLVLGIRHAQREQLLRLRRRAELDALEHSDLGLHRVVTQLEVFARRHRFDQHVREGLDESRERLALQFAEQTQRCDRLLANVVVQRRDLPYELAEHVVEALLLQLDEMRVHALLAARLRRLDFREALPQQALQVLLSDLDCAARYLIKPIFQLIF